jgi:hypothetical protein
MSRSPSDARLVLAVFAVLAIVGSLASFGRGSLPRRSADHAAVVRQVSPDGTAPDLALYRQIIADVRHGRGYYEAAAERIPQFGFPTASPLNWRLPTYAWLLSWLPSEAWIQGVLVAIGVAGLILTFRVEWLRRASVVGEDCGAARRPVDRLAGPILATLLMFGVVRWGLDGPAYLAQEVWAGTLIVLSLAAHALGSRMPGWRVVAVAAGTLALLIRELALPYCLVAGGVALAGRRWREAAGWIAGIGAFALLVVYHVAQVHAHQPAGAAGGGTGLAQWLRFGGLDFVLLTLRMNSLLFAASAVVLWVSLLGSFVGLSQSASETSRVACLAAVLYVAAFAIVGRTENFYWGLLLAPLLPSGLAAAPAALQQLWNAAWGDAASAASGPAGETNGPVVGLAARK